jgi:hypothetical protein
VSDTANAQYTNNRPLVNIPQRTPNLSRQSPEDRENNQQQMQMYQQDQENFRRQMDGAAQQGMEHERMEQLRDALRERLER